jgi:hypothetical protein
VPGSTSGVGAVDGIPTLVPQSLEEIVLGHPVGLRQRGHERLPLAVGRGGLGGDREREAELEVRLLLERPGLLGAVVE